MNAKRACFLMILVFILASSVSTIAPSFAQDYVTISATESYNMINAKPFLVVLDVRNQTEYDVDHIRNAKLIPLSELSARLDELNKSDEILVYCGSGARSAQASQILVNNGFQYVYNMALGLAAWKYLGFPVYTKYPSIQQAINDATAASTLRISNGIYYEHVIVNKSIALVGENKLYAILNGNILTGTADTAFYVKADNVSISDFTIETFGCFCDNVSGVRVEDYRKKTSITDNIIINNGYGIKVDSAVDILIANNTITSGFDRSITVWNSSRISITENNITQNTRELYLERTTNFNISYNVISKSLMGNGLTLNMSNNGRIIGNTISMNYPNYGLQLQQSSNNTLFHNNFVSNRINVASDNSTSNWAFWEEGNFWSDYNGTDNNNDGIGDTPYSPRETLIDPYPLMGYFNSFYAGTWDSRMQTVDVISNSSISDFDLNITSATLRFNATGANGTGFARIRIPNLIVVGMLQNEYVVRIDGQVVTFNNWTRTSDEYIYVSYSQSEHQIEVIAGSAVPEFMFSIILPLFMMTALLAVAIHLRLKNPRKTVLKHSQFTRI